MVLQNVRVALRGLLRAPGFAAAAILTIALGIGINTAMFSLVHAVLLAPLPYPDSHQLTFVTTGRQGAEGGRRPLSGPELVELGRGATQHQGLGAIWPTTGTLVDDGRPEPVRIGVVSSNFLTLLGTPTVRGRWFRASDEGAGSEPAMIISGGLWQSRFGGADVIGRRIRFDGGWGFQGGVYTIVGVMPADFEMLLPLEASVPRTVDAWITFNGDLASMPRTLFYMRTIGRIRPEASMAAAQADLQKAGADMIARYTSYQPGRYFFAVPLYEDVVKRATTPLTILQAAGLLVLLVACANVAGLMLVRGRAYRKELGVRQALGASTRRLVALLMTESLTLAVLGGLLGVFTAYVALRAVPVIVPDTLPRAFDASLQLPVLAFSLAATLISGVVFGLLTLLQTRRLDVVTVLKAAGRGTHGGPSRWWRSALVTVEIALSLVLLIGAGLLIRTFINLRAVDPGFSWNDVATFKLSLPADRYGNPAVLSRFTRELERGLRAIPGVQAAGVINQLPLDDIPNWSTPYRLRTAAPTQETPSADARLVTPGYFQTIGARLISGRWITERDDETQPMVLMIDERLAKRAWPNGSPLEQEMAVQVATPQGFQIRWGRVVGVIRNIRHHELSEEVREQVFVPFAQAPRNQVAVALRTQSDLQAVMRDVRTRIAAADPDLAPTQPQALAGYVGRKEAPVRFTTTLAAVFAGFSLLLACVGIYGVVAYAVAQRTSELAVRAALGARRGELVRLVLKHGLLLTVAGVALGLGLSVGVVGWMQTLLLGIPAGDVLTFTVASLLLAATGLLACYIPARRAGAVDPARVLRTD